MIKKSVIAGSFYPANKSHLEKVLKKKFNVAERQEELFERETLLSSKARVCNKTPFAIVVPHAGYVYSGQTAANVYNLISMHFFKKAIILAPLHRGVCNFDFHIGNYDAYETPMGLLYTNKKDKATLLSKPGFGSNEGIDKTEHSLEVHLPFLSYLYPKIEIVPILFCNQNIHNAEILSNYIHELMEPETILIISTDLSHFYDSITAELMDKELIEYFKINDIDTFYNLIKKRKIEACGYGGLLSLMYLNKKYKDISISRTYYSHSGEVSHDTKRVVGYFSCVISASNYQIIIDTYNT